MSLPKSAKSVFKGTIFEVYQWEQKMFDGSFKIFEKVKRHDTVMLFPIYKNRIVICKQKQPHRKKFYYSFIGGMIDPGEKPLLAAKRELLEETGMKAQSIALWNTYPSVHKVLWISYIYVARGCEIVAKQSLDGGEKIELLYVTFDELIEMIEEGTFNFTTLENDIFKMEKQGKLEEFKKMLLG